MNVAEPTRVPSPHALGPERVRLDDFSTLVRRLLETARPSQSPFTVLRAAVSALVDPEIGLLDFAQVAFGDGAHDVVASGVSGEVPVVLRLPNHDLPFPALQELADRGRPDLLALPAPPVSWELLAELVPDEPVRAAVQLLRPDLLRVVPLRIGGFRCGTLLCASSSGRQLPELSALGEITALIADLIEATLAVAESRQVARQVIAAPSPQALPDCPHIEVAHRLRQADQGLGVGGDFVDVHGAPDDLILVIGDAAGHGIGAAAMAHRLRDTARTAAFVHRRPDRILELVNRVFAAAANEAEDLEAMATLIVARVQPHPGGALLSLSGAGHPSPLLVRADGTVQELFLGGPALGLLPDATFPLATEVLGAGDLVIGYTDGISEARDGDREFGVMGILGRVTGHESIDSVVESIDQAVDEHVRGPRVDDSALLAVRCTGAVR